MKKINLFSRLWSSGGNSQSSDVGYDCRLTVGSPSGLESSKVLKFVSVLALIFTLGVGNVRGADVTQTYTLDDDDNGSTVNTGDVSWNIGASAIVASSSNMKLTGTITVTLPSGATLQSVSLVKSNNWGSGATVTLYAGSTSLNVFSSPGSFTLTSNKTNGTYKFTKTGTSSKNAWVKTISVTYTPGSGGSVSVTGVTVSPTTKSIIPDETFTITPTISPANATTKTVSWSSANSSVASVSSGTVTGVASGGPVNITCTTTDGGFTANCAVTVRSVTLQARDEDGNAIGVGGPGAPTRSGTTITAAANAGNYVFKQWQITNATPASTTTSPTTLSNPTGSVTVTAVYYKPIPVSWNKNGSLYETTYTGYNQKPVFPDAPSSCDATSNTFYGWATSTWENTVDNLAGKTVYTSAGDMPDVTTPVTYNAVFAKATAGATSWTKENSSISAGDVIILVNETASKELSGVGLISTTSCGLASDYVTTPAGTFPLTVETGNGGKNFSFKNGTNYLSWSSGNSLITSATKDNASSWTVNNPASGNFTFSNVGTTDRKLQYNSGSPRFCCYTSSQTVFQIYKRTTSYTYSKYLTTCCTDPGLNYGTGSVTKTFGDAAFTNALTNSHSVGVTYALSSVSPAGCVSINASTGQVTINAAGSATVTASFAGNATYCADEASYTLTVNKADISPSLSYESGTLVIGNNSSSPTVGGNSGGGTVTYAVTTANPAGCVTVNASGVVTAVAEGTATITATIGATTNYNGGSATANFTVTCGAPSSVDISGAYQFYPGETISLTATPTGGAGTPVTYQWKKDGVNIVGATSATYTKNNATVADAGSYTCTVQYGSNCATTSSAFKLKCMQFYLKTSGGADISNHALTKVDATHATLSLSLTGGTTYKFRVTDGCGNWFGNSDATGITSGNCNNWTMPHDADAKVTTSGKSATYTFNFDFSGGLLGSEMKVSVVYPSSNQASGKVIYWDNEVNKWNGSKLWYRIGKSTHNSNTQLSKVAGTANFYSVTTSQYDGFEYWHIANNVGQGTGNIFWTKDNSGSGLEITNAMGFEGAPVTDATVTVTPTTTHSTGGSSDNDNCEFYTYSITSGVKSYTVTSSATNCTVAMEKYNNDAGSSTTALASGGTVMPTQYVKVTVTPNTGYQFSSVSVTNGTTVTAAAAGTPGVYYITGNATVTATCTVKSCTVNFDKNSGSGGDASTTATYGSAMTTVTAPTRTGYTFDGYWDGETDNDGSGTQYYLANGTSARDWDKDVTAAQTLYAKWNAKQYTIELDREGASTGATSVTATYDAGTLVGWSAPSKTGYTFGGYWSGDNGTGTLVISTTGVLQNSVTISAVNWTDASGHWIKDGGVTVYAKWTAEQYTITYKDQGNVAYSGSNGGSLPTTHTYGAATALVDGVKSGYRFDGWFDNSSCTGAAVTSIGATAKTADFTLYAKWTQVYTVTWYVNGDEWTSGTTSGNTEVVSGQRVSALPTAPTSSDCDDSKKFVGWKAAEIDGTSAGNPGGIFTTQAGSPTISANTNFYAVFADVTGGDVIELTFPDDNSENNGLTSNQYTSTWTAMSGTTSFSISNFNNNNWAGSWTNIRCGRKSTASTATITTDAVIGFRVDSIYLTMDAITASGVDTMKLFIDDNSSFSSPAVMGIKKQATTHVLKIASPAKDQYYKFEFTCNNSYSSGSGYVRISKIAYKQQKDTANYVTTCASCDDDATFTNTTPAVSAIGCTGATLTATGGLATLGAAGCNVSDYGFVIGTADDPAIGGVGVTKYQVGTTNPTTGEDFSYDATGLTKGTHYYIRAYAINRHGTAYSSSTNFWTNNVSSIAITTAPTKTNYIVGETFDATGMVVTATMASGATEDVTSDVTYSSSALTAGTSQNFAINYTLCETAKSVNQVINVYTLTVTEGANPSYGTATNSSANIVSITGLGDHKTYTVTVTSSNATAVDNGDNTWSIINPTGNVTVRVDYADAVQVKVYYKVDGVTVTGLTQDVYQSETTTLPTASELATAMAAQSMDIPDDDYPNFVGWSETEFPAQTAEPSIVSGTPVISAEKIFYAVYSNINKKSIKPSDFAGSYATNEGEKTIDDEKYQIHDICLQSSQIQFKSTPGYLYTKETLAYIKKIEITGLDLVVNACSDNAGTLDGDAITPTGTAPYVYTFPASKQYFKIKGKGGTDKVSLIEIFYANSTVYYMTQFCATKVVLSHNSPEHGSVEFSRSSIATCGSDKNVSLTIIPDAGYKLTGWTVNTASGYADAKTTSPSVVTTNNNSAAQNITLTFAQDANKNYDVTATFALMTVESWTWTHNSAAIPDPFNLYVGQTARFDVAYTPAGVDNSKKTYTRTKNNTYINWEGVLNANYTTISGRTSTGENTTPVTFTHADGPTTTVNVKVLPLPAVHFGDIVHNVEFVDVVATLSDNALSPTKTTPTHVDFDGATKNTCEEQHLHLVGWIREDWPALVTYLNGGAQPSTSDITTAGDDASGNAYFFAPGASINTQTFNGVTFYAVWAKVE